LRRLQNDGCDAYRRLEVETVKQNGSAATRLEAVRDEGWEGEDDLEWKSFSDEVRSLVRHLIEESGRRGAASEVQGGQEAVILDLVVDGVRCVLTRRPAGPERQIDGVALSPREREIARMIAKGYPNKVIARVLEISSWTVSTHLRRIFAKLGVSTRAAMVAQLLEEGQLKRRLPGSGRP
jgi:DNA-binding CsgD family transcriptional regulator